MAGGMASDGGKDALLRASFAVSLDFLRRASIKGIPLVPGTDGTTGIQLHRELEVMVQAGIPAADVLRQATYGSAQVMGRTGDLGSIAPGKAADLVLLEGDPTQDISAVRRIVWVLHGGRRMDREETLTALGLGLHARP
jgi:imidazolonepropionase-like amidohydrolase